MQSEIQNPTEDEDDRSSTTFCDVLAYLPSVMMPLFAFVLLAFNFLFLADSAFLDLRGLIEWNLQNNDPGQEAPDAPGSLSVPYPGSRIWHCFTPIGSDTLLVFGGMVGGSIRLNDTWEYSLVSHSWAHIDTTPDSTPSARTATNCHALYTFPIPIVILFGGADDTGAVNDLYSYSLATHDWSNVTIFGGAPPRARSVYGKWSRKSPAVGMSVSCGYGSGFVECHILDTLTMVSPTSGLWEESLILTGSPSVPVAKRSVVTWVDFAGTRERLYLLGGRSVSNFGDLYYCDLAGTALIEDPGWILIVETSIDLAPVLSSSGNERINTILGAATAMVGEDFVVLHGGESVGGLLAAIWTFDLRKATEGTWDGFTLLRIENSDWDIGTASPSYSSDLTPGGRIYHGLTKNPREQELWVHGGVTTLGDGSDLWSLPFNLSSSSFAFCDSIPAGNPSVCNSHGTCVSLNRCKCGDGYSGSFCQWAISQGVVSYEGIRSWANLEVSRDQRIPGAGEGIDPPFPESRSHYCMTVVPYASSMLLILFGGYGSTSFLDDTWIWSFAHSAWTKTAPSTVPDARSGCACHAHQTPFVSLHAGYGDGGYLDDVVTFDPALVDWQSVVAFGTAGRIPRSKFASWPMKNSNGFRVTGGMQDTTVIGMGSIDELGSFTFQSDASGSWSSQTIGGGDLPPREMPFFWPDYDGANEKLWLFGGRTDLGVKLGDLLYVDMALAEPGWITVIDFGVSQNPTINGTSVSPGSRSCSQQAAVLGRRAVIHGGRLEDPSSRVGDTWLIDMELAVAGALSTEFFQLILFHEEEVIVSTPRWGLDTANPDGRDGHSLAVFDGEMYLFGGLEPATTLADFWKVNPFPDENPSPIPEPPSRLPLIIGLAVGLGIVGCVCILLVIVGVIVGCVLCIRKSRPLDGGKHKNQPPKDQKLSSMSSSPFSSPGVDGMDLSHLKLNSSLETIPLESLDFGRRLGSGGSGSTVYLAQWAGTEVAAKIFILSESTSQEGLDSLLSEALLMSRLHHPSVLRLYGVSVGLPKLGMVIEYCSQGDLRVFLCRHKRENGGSYSWETKVRWLKEICNAMEYLHSKQVLHRDLKCENVLLNDGLNAKVMDFGLSRLVEQHLNESKTKGIGTGVYMAPEMVLGLEYDSAVDVFAFGILSFIVMTENFSPYDSADLIEFKVANNPDFRPDMSPLSSISHSGIGQLRQLVQSCWRHEAHSRPTFKQIIELMPK